MPDMRRRTTTRRQSATSWALHGLAVAGAAGAVALDRRWRRGRFGDAPVAPAVVSVAYYGVLKALESRRPYRQDWQHPDSAERRTDGAFAVSILAVLGAATAATRPIASRLPGSLRADRLPVPLAAVGAVLGYDLVHSRLHHLGHLWGPAWRLHSVHHSPERLYWFNATRFHVAETFIDVMAETLVVAVLGLNRDQHIAFQAMRGMYGQLQHCNVELRSGALDHVFSTPDLHRWHHSTVYEEGDTNYGAITSLWDHLFGTWFRPDDRDGPQRVGVGRMPDFPQRYCELQRVPVDWAAIRDRNAATWGAPEGLTDVPDGPVSTHHRTLPRGVGDDAERTTNHA